jgi:predicted ribosome quality control (RQC) complex YloA/Tae2 family protein
MIQLSSVDVRALVAEFSCLRGAKFETVYGVGTGFVFRFYAKKHIDLYVEPPKWVYLTKKEEDANPATPFISQLRSHLDGGTVLDVLQPGFTRVIQFIVRKKELIFHLFFELFDKGNIILTDSSNTILCLDSVQKWTARTVDVGQIYGVDPKPFPHELSIPPLTDLTQLQQFLTKDCSLGTWYATHCLALHAQTKDSISHILTLLLTTCQPTVYFSVDTSPSHAKHMSVLAVNRDEFLSKSFDTLSLAYSYCHVKADPLKDKKESLTKKVQAKLDQQKKIIDKADIEIIDSYKIANYITEHAPLIDEYILAHKHKKTIKYIVK